MYDNKSDRGNDRGAKNIAFIISGMFQALLTWCPSRSWFVRMWYLALRANASIERHLHLPPSTTWASESTDPIGCHTLRFPEVRRFNSALGRLPHSAIHIDSARLLQWMTTSHRDKSWTKRRENGSDIWTRHILRKYAPFVITLLIVAMAVRLTSWLAPIAWLCAIPCDLIQNLT